LGAADLMGVADTGRLLAVFTNGFAIHPHATPLGAEPGAELPVPVEGRQFRQSIQ
jgi:hypothetical protein